MKYTLAFDRRAEADIAKAMKWYDAQKPGLGQRFLTTIVSVTGTLCSLPYLGANSAFGLRRIRVRSFPYIIYYHVSTARIEVIAVLHQRRHHRVWRSP